MIWLSKFTESVKQLMRITCRDTSSVISEMVDRPVSFPKYWRAKIHLAMCGVCRYYKAQFSILNRLAYQLSIENSPEKIGVAVYPKSKSLMKKTLKSKFR